MRSWALAAVALVMLGAAASAQGVDVLGVTSVGEAAGGSKGECVAPIRRNLLVVIYRPKDIFAVMRERFNETWLEPKALNDELIGELRSASGGAAGFQVTDSVELDEFPPMHDGPFDMESYARMWPDRRENPPKKHFDYRAFLRDPRLKIRDRIAAGEIDEVWVWAMPFSQMYESRMDGAGAYWCNAPALFEWSGRRFVIMGFNYQRTVGLAMHSFGHRAESILKHKYGFSLPFFPNDWDRFTSQVGTVHRPPGVTKDYDYLDPPDAAWADPEDPDRGWLRWWFGHLERASWWDYILRPDAHS